MKKTVVLTAVFLLAAGAATGALITNYAIKTTPEGTDRVLLIDPNDPTNTKSATLESIGTLLGGGPVDLTAPGPIGSVTPNTAAFTDLQAATFEVSPPAAGETGEIGLPEDPANGTDLITLKAPASVSGDLVFTLPGADGSAGQCFSTNGAGILGFIDVLKPANNLSDVSNPTSARTALGAWRAPSPVPATSSATCLAPEWAYDADYLYFCPTNNTWVRVGWASWQ